ncbi:MAG: prepilin-type N-terminal cleavage/methylation domain-containing protein [Armatimonadota bacterium]
MKQKKRLGFTLVELLIVIIIISVLASVAVPKFNSAWKSGTESRLHQNLMEYRNAIERFHSDTGLYPASMSDIRLQTAPATGLGSTGTSQPIAAGSWNGPYFKLYSNPSSYHPDIRNLGYTYTVSSPNVGKLVINSSARDLNGVRYSSW